MMHMSPGAPVWLASRVMLAERGDDLFRQWELVRGNFGLEEIHDLRVASRRLREGLALFSSFYPAKNQKYITSQVKRLTQVLGAMRNTDEAILFFSGLLETVSDSSVDEVQKLVAQLQSERTSEQKILRRSLKDLNLTVIRKSFIDTRDNPMLFDSKLNPFTPITEFLRDKIMERELAMLELLPTAKTEVNVSDQHRLRIAVKRFRYRSEIAEPIAGPELQTLLLQTKRYQEILGKMHDLDVFLDIIGRLMNDSEPRGQLSDIIIERRHGLFEDFEYMLESNPLEMISARIRSLL